MAGINQSDKSITGDITKARIVSRKKPHRDLDLSLKIHPIRKDIIPLKDDNAIKNALRNLLVSNFYDRPFSRDKGANLKGLLFEPADVITRITMRKNLETVIRKYEPRVLTRSIIINDSPDTNSYHIKVNFKIKENDTDESVSIVLRRLK
jgi:phage baseplate assembly protein W